MHTKTFYSFHKIQNDTFFEEQKSKYFVCVVLEGYGLKTAFDIDYIQDDDYSY